MDEYNNINWRDNLLDDEAKEEAFQACRINKVINKEINVRRIRNELNKYGQLCCNKRKCPGASYFTKTLPFSKFSTHDHETFINALKIIQSGRTNLNIHELRDRDFFNTQKPNIINESKRYLKLAESAWNGNELQKGIGMHPDLYKYGMEDRLKKIALILKMPRYFSPVDALPWSYSDSETPIEMVHAANVLDIGIVSQYTPPLLEDAFCFNPKSLPEIKINQNASRLPMSQDVNVQEYLRKGCANVAISLSTLKKLLNFTDTEQHWIIPLTIINIDENKRSTNRKSGAIKKMYVFDKPLPKQIATNIDLNEKCHKLLLRSNFCCLEGFKFDQQDKAVDDPSNTQTDSIFHNATYKLWTLQEERNPLSIRAKCRNTKTFQILVRNKIHACTPCEQGLQAVTVVPKLEYQLNFGANVYTKQETIKQWVDLYFRPQSIMERVRIHYLKSEVVKIDKVNLGSVNMEATQIHKLRTQLNFGAFYCLLVGLDNHKAGNYLLKHEPKHGAFVALLQQTEDSQAVGVLDLHLEYSLKSTVVNPVNKPWCPIDGNILLPIFEKNGRFPGLLKPRKLTKKEQMALKKH